MNVKTLDLSHNWIREISLNSNGTRLGHKTNESLSLSYNEFVYWPHGFVTITRASNPCIPN